MVEIYTVKGESYSFDPITQRIFRDGVFIPRSEVEPVYSGNGKDTEPVFSGFYVRSNNTIITRSGNIKQVVDINSIK